MSHNFSVTNKTHNNYRFKKLSIKRNFDNFDHICSYRET